MGSGSGHCSVSTGSTESDCSLPHGRHFPVEQLAHMGITRTTAIDRTATWVVCRLTACEAASDAAAPTVGHP